MNSCATEITKWTGLTKETHKRDTLSKRLSLHQQQATSTTHLILETLFQTVQLGSIICHYATHLFLDLILELRFGLHKKWTQQPEDVFYFRSNTHTNLSQACHVKHRIRTRAR